MYFKHAGRVGGRKSRSFCAIDYIVYQRQYIYYIVYVCVRAYSNVTGKNDDELTWSLRGAAGKRRERVPLSVARDLYRAPVGGGGGGDWRGNGGWRKRLFRPYDYIIIL